MNHIHISGRILVGPAFHADSDVQVAAFTLCCGSERDVVPVAATRNAAIEVSQFQNGDSVSVEGRVIWNSGRLEILAERIRQHREGAYRKENEWRSRVLPKVKGF
jgi:hypothetical protein